MALHFYPRWMERLPGERFIYPLEQLASEENQLEAVAVDEIELGQAFLLDVGVDYVTLFAAKQLDNGRLIFLSTRINAKTGKTYPYTNTSCDIKNEKIVPGETLTYSPIRRNPYPVDDYRQKMLIRNIWHIQNFDVIEQQRHLHQLRYTPSTDVTLQHRPYDHIRDVYPSNQYL